MTTSASQSPPLAKPWHARMAPAACSDCQRVFLLPPEALPIQPCPQCFRSNLAVLSDPAQIEVFPPELVMPFRLSPELLQSQVERFSRGIPYPPEDMNAENIRGRLVQLYLPVWLLDAETRAYWQADVGFNYDVVSHQEHYSQHTGGWQTQEVTKTRIRWEPRLGKLQRTYHNLAAPALEEDQTLRTALGAFDYRTASLFSAGWVDSAVIRLPDRSPNDAWVEASNALKQLASAECVKAAGADHIREFNWQAEYPTKNWTHLLLPVYTAYYKDDLGTACPMIIHGQTGQISGLRRASPVRGRRAALGILGTALVLFLVSLILGLLGIVFPPLLLFAALGFIVAVVVAVGALIPVIRVWNFNRQNPGLPPA